MSYRICIVLAADHIVPALVSLYLWSIAKQIIPTYISHSRPLFPDGIYLIFLTKFEREKPDLSLYIHVNWTLSKEASGTITWFFGTVKPV